ncbi:class Ib ribonucleoside-diphosphate reductase assembly flavoprotein NrdI [Calidithermus chliarophilus]|uniref:class Ib ribonucleoside-diphosphate reductase assembly flavoprotein NrdI n=1 Tax=Calidithermus chliarophilus TaxID=52023 RepID=UPI0004140208|nr:class Ib ribonucleoside-diphosphate reductase assembly flavoprotein NrdI [Calidithermus chliarophilus]
MLIVYASRTGNVERFVRKLPAPRLLQIRTGEEEAGEPCVLLTYTTGLGQVPHEVERFARRNQAHIRAVAASGNRNWGSNYAKAADQLAAAYGFEVIHKFELSGRAEDVARFWEGVRALALPRA